MSGGNVKVTNAGPRTETYYMSQEEVARALGVDRLTVRREERSALRKIKAFITILKEHGFDMQEFLED